MDIKDSPVKGGIAILHTEEDGKHHYEVEKVLKFKKGGEGGGAFARKGDKLLTINGVDLQDLSPEAFVKILTEGNPMLTVHQASRAPPPERCLEEGAETRALHPVSKESTMLSFNLEMRREDVLDDLESDSYRPEEVNKVDDEVDDLFLVAMTNTRISVVRGRGCGDGSSCHNCGKSDCNFNEVVMVAESSKVTLVSRGMGNLEKVQQLDNIFIENYLYRTYLRRKSTYKTCIPSLSATPEKITIYHYKSDCIDGEFRGVPVVLNFTSSNCFLKCVKNSEGVFLCVEACDKHRLKSIRKDDEEIQAFVFYMKAEMSKQRRFESAYCQGWFIHTSNETKVHLGKPQGMTGDQSFFFVIHK
uniref:Interleukin-1 n=1 Tax=Hucho hucho TaxID=62062 RepID=A0A4W5PDP2_9TELE